MFTSSEAIAWVYEFIHVAYHELFRIFAVVLVLLLCFAIVMVIAVHVAAAFLMLMICILSLFARCEWQPDEDGGV